MAMTEHKDVRGPLAFQAPEPRDEDLEAAIDRAGREKVFARAGALGWGAATPPKWVWWNIAHEIEREGQT